MYMVLSRVITCSRSRIWIWTIFFLWIICSVYCDHEIRRLKAEINRGCNITYPSSCQEWTNLSLIHIQGDNLKDSLHYIWSFNGSPSMLLARTPHDSKLTISWDVLQKNNFTNITDPVISFNGPAPFYNLDGLSAMYVTICISEFSGMPYYVYNASNNTSYHTKNFTWERLNDSIISESIIKLSFQSTNYSNHSLGPEGFFKFSIIIRNTDGYDDVLPYMLHNSNNSMVEIAFNKVEMEYPKKNYAASRVGYGLSLVQPREEHLHERVMKIEEEETLDDEHSPGVFDTFRLRTPVIGPNLDQSYLEWKAICYTDVVRNIVNSIDVQSYKVGNTTTFNSTYEAVNSSVLLMFYGKDNFTDNEALLVQYTNITFGTQGDGWYNNTPKLTWTFVTGYGVPPDDYVSLLVILVLAVGLGVPALLISGAGIYILLKRIAKQSDDLLLER